MAKKKKKLFRSHEKFPITFMWNYIGQCVCACAGVVYVMLSNVCNRVAAKLFSAQSRIYRAYELSSTYIHGENAWKYGDKEKDIDVLYIALAIYRQQYRFKHISGAIWGERMVEQMRYLSEEKV